MFATLMGLKSISPAELDRRMRSGAVVPIDVNSKQSWTKHHVPGAPNLDPAEYSGNELPAAKDTALVFYCSNYLCRKAPNAARRAKQFGYTNVMVMSAGLSGWLAAGLPVETG